MRVIVSAPTRFHLFDLARELDRRQVLTRLFTAYPRIRVDPSLKAVTTALPIHGLLRYASRRIPDGLLRRELEWHFIEQYDLEVARRLPEADVVVALSGRALHTLRRARELGAVAVCDRGSCHIVHQDQVLAEEHARWGVPYRCIDPRGIAKELDEYDTADLITVPSRYACATFIAYGVPAGKVAVVPYGVGLDEFQPGPGSGGRFRVLFVGRISLQKGVPYLLEAVRPLMALPRFEVCLAGATEPDSSAWLRHFEGLRLLGHIPRRDLALLYASSSVLVLPSVQDGLALVIAQAMASGLPVIATPESGAEELLTDGVEGFVVPARSANAIRDRLLRLYEDNDLRLHMGAAARAKAEALGGWSQYGALAHDIYLATARRIGRPIPGRNEALGGTR